MRVDPPTSRHAPESRRAPRLQASFAALLLVAAAPQAAARQELTPLPRLASEGVVDRTSEDRIRARWSVVPPAVYPGQSANLVITVHVDKRFLDEHMVQPFTRRLDLPIALDEPRIGGLELGAWGVNAKEPSGVLLALGDRLVRALPLDSPAPDDREWRSVELETRVTPTRAGRFELPAPVVRFAAAESFREELLGRTPIAPRLAFARGTPSEWIVPDFPEAGRDPDFAGALGSYHLSAQVANNTPRLGDVIALSVVIDGAPLEDGALPPLDRMRGLHLVSQTVTRTAESTELRAELRVERVTVREIPSIVLHSFDPESATYLSAASEAIPLRIGVPTDAARGDDAPRSAPRWLVWPFLGAGVGLAVLFYRRSRARRNAHRRVDADPRA